ncbi:hypothetical protein KIN20_007112 [Parelaphostrongylus tenuis]|uniref:Uncharacterized protein n=1 Tax=Parelaphostrongylus tenuis TaxID=148309 RepID=A0AAD5MP36_PARTN|nr:hypothetical protein KIN20_007112 [Parelaphostrongylus tenuis]
MKVVVWTVARAAVRSTEHTVEDSTVTVIKTIPENSVKINCCGAGKTKRRAVKMTCRGGETRIAFWCLAELAMMPRDHDEACMDKRGTKIEPRNPLP